MLFGGITAFGGLCLIVTSVLLLQGLRKVGLILLFLLSFWEVQVFPQKVILESVVISYIFVFVHQKLKNVLYPIIAVRNFKTYNFILVFVHQRLKKYPIIIVTFYKSVAVAVREVATSNCSNRI